MQYAKLGRTNIEVSRFCLGCMGFGKVTKNALHKWTLGPVETKAIIAQALAAGITFFDTAMAYSFGTSEEYVGEALRSLAPRDQWVIATKAGRLARKPGETSKRLELDTFAKGKYDATAAQDAIIIDRVSELADKYETTMTAVSLAWLLTKVTSPVVGATKPHHIEGPAAAADLTLAAEDIAYLEEPYVPHALVGVMANQKRG